MKPSERAKALNLVDYVLTIHDKSADGESCLVQGGFSALGVQAVVDAITAAEREAFEAGWTAANTDPYMDGAHGESTRKRDYEYWRKERDDED